MNHSLRDDANFIIEKAISEVKPDAAVKKALAGKTFSGRVFLVAVGKAGYQMAKAASELVEYEAGVVVTKYDHVFGSIPRVTCFEAGHPIPDENSFRGTQAVLDMTENLSEQDTVLFLLSGGGSALFEQPLIPAEELQKITSALLKSGADVTEINTIRKHLSGVKGGRFAEHIYPAKVCSVILSDIIGDPVDMIASGPTVADASTCEQAKKIAIKYNLSLSSRAQELLDIDTPKEIINGEFTVIGSVKELCKVAGNAAASLGYDVIYLTDRLCCEAREAGIMLGNIAGTYADCRKKKAFVLGGETVVHLLGDGLGGRNQEIAVGAMKEIAGLSNVAVFSVGSDGTDGPCDAAGGYADGDSFDSIQKAGLDFDTMQKNNDTYHLLQAIDGLIITGPTGTNVNDFAMVLIGE